VSEINLMNTVGPYRDERIPIFTVGMMIEDLYGTQLLNNIADETGGSYTNVSNVQDLKNILQNIYVNKDKRLLVDKRYGLTHSSILYAFLRILFIMLTGIFIGTALGLIFDNRNLVKGFAIGGTVSGLIAGIILEVGFAVTPAFGSVYRAIADVLLAAVFTLFSAAVSLNDNSQKNKPGYLGNTGLSRSKGFNNDRNTGSKSF
jgi:Ca-activated chloride channel homolog